MTSRKLPIGIQSFEDLRKNEYVYIDKTEYVWNMVNSGKTYFLSRPRRFGKSLLLTTIKAYFEGKKELFHGLYIEDQENSKGKSAWTSYPVIYFSLSSGEFNTPDGLEQALKQVLISCEYQYGISSDGLNLTSRFKNDIENIYRVTGKQIVVLVDEYDKPLLDTMNVNQEQEEKNRQLYSSFFSVLKDDDAYIKFTFITGVTKFAKVTIFSGMNQPRDISMSDEYSAACGITEQEMKENLLPEIEMMSTKKKCSVQETEDKLAEKYDGYCFSPEGTHVYNPFSVLNALADKHYKRYWFSTGTPSFLVRSLENSGYTAEKLNDDLVVTEDIIMDYRGNTNDPIPLAYQSGYLTIKSYDEDNDLYHLGFPNDEVRFGYMNILSPSLLGGLETDRETSLTSMGQDLKSGNLNSFMNRLSSLFASIPYAEGIKPDYEVIWRNTIYIILMLMGQRVQCEVHTAQGRADCVVKTNSYIYIFEFKLDKSANEALNQIDQKHYADAYMADHRQVFKVGVNFSSVKRNIQEYKYEQERSPIQCETND